MQTENTSGPSKTISEMDAPELLAFAKRIHPKIEEGTITDNELSQYNLAKMRYKTKTGRLLNAKELMYS